MDNAALDSSVQLNPLMTKGRADARETMATAARLVRKAGDTKTADAADTLSTALQLVLTTALVDGYEPKEVYQALCGAVSWSVMRLEADDRLGVLTAITSGVIDQMKAAETVAPETVN